MDLLEKVEEEVTALRGSGALDPAFQGWKAQSEGLRSFGNAESCISYLRDPRPGLRRRKDAALAALCGVASGGDQQAGKLLLWLLLPGVMSVRHSLGGRDVLGTPDLNAELVAGVWEAATKVRAKSHDVAARMLNGGRWRALDAIEEAIEWAKRSQPLGDEFEEIPEPEAREGGLPGILVEAVREGVISYDKAELVLSSRQNIHDVAARLGLTLCAAQNRKRRARMRLRAWLAESSRIPPRFLDQEPPPNLPKNSQGSPDQDRLPRASL